jgi:hypothetical protein
MTDEIEKLVFDLKSDSRFKILRDKNPWGFGASGGTYYDEYTELESKNLKILYVKEIFIGYTLEEDITVTDKRENVYAFCNSSHTDYLFKDKPIIKKEFNIEELKEYIDKNA